MIFSDLIEMVKTGVFQIALKDNAGTLVGAGTAFVSCGYLITNYHVYVTAKKATNHKITISQSGRLGQRHVAEFDSQSWASKLVISSNKQNYDFAVLNIPEIFAIGHVHQFSLLDPKDIRVGDEIAFIGYPLMINHSVIQRGIISSLYKKGNVQVLQLDASVNKGNSGGPLFKADTGEVIGIITRKETGLSAKFDALRNDMNTFQAQAKQSTGVKINGLDTMGTIAKTFEQLYELTNEIERQANVGLGYAFSISELMSDNLIDDRLKQMKDCSL